MADRPHPIRRAVPGSSAVLDLLRDGLRRVNEQRNLVPVIQLVRRALPGDPEFGDPLSTAGTEPVQVAARRAWALNQGRLSLIGEAGLAALQVADWLGDTRRRGKGQHEVAILFTDLEGFSSWALEAGDDRSLELLRSLGVTVETRVDDYGGRIVKRLGDGIMAVFDDPAAAVEAVHEVMAAIRDVRVDGYQPRMRAGIHYGEPRRMGGDYLGVDVTVAARLCDMAHGGQVLISEEVCRHLDGDVEVVPRLVPLKKGTPDDLEVYAVAPADNPPALSS